MVFRDLLEKVCIDGLGRCSFRGYQFLPYSLYFLWLTLSCSDQNDYLHNHEKAH